MTEKNVLATALNATQSLPDDDPDKKLILDQLEYLDGLLEGRCSDKSDLTKISLGVIAAREYEDFDPEFAEKLYQVEKKVVHFLKYS